MKKFSGINFWKKVILTSFLELGQKNFRILMDNFGKKFKTSFYVSRRTHTGHLFWKKKLKLSFFSDFRWKFWDNGKKISAGLPKLQKLSRGTTWGKNFSKRGTYYFFKLLMDFFFLLLAQKIARIVKTAFYVASEGFGEEHCLNFCTMFQNFSEFELKSKSKCSQQGCHNCHPGIQRKNFMKVFLLYVS